MFETLAAAVHTPASLSPASLPPDELPLLEPELLPELEPLLDPELLPLLDPELLPELEPLLLPLLELALPSGPPVVPLLLLLQAPMVRAVREARVKTEMVANEMRRLMGGGRTALLRPSPGDLLNELRQSDDAGRRVASRRRAAGMPTVRCPESRESSRPSVFPSRAWEPTRARALEQTLLDEEDEASEKSPGRSAIGGSR
jgi:hypothetical protein